MKRLAMPVVVTAIKRLPPLEQKAGKKTKAQPHYSQDFSDTLKSNAAADADVFIKVMSSTVSCDIIDIIDPPTLYTFGPSVGRLIACSCVPPNKQHIAGAPHSSGQPKGICHDWNDKYALADQYTEGIATTTVRIFDQLDTATGMDKLDSGTSSPTKKSHFACW